MKFQGRQCGQNMLSIDIPLFEIGDSHSQKIKIACVCVCVLKTDCISNLTHCLQNT